jgi:hypothetical protein
MQNDIDTDTDALEVIFTYSMTAARLARYLEKTLIVGALTKSINKISEAVAGLLGNSHALRPEGAPRLDSEPDERGEPGEPGDDEFNVVNAVDDLRQLVARTAALATAAESLFDEVLWGEDDGNSRQLERLAHLVGATAEATRAAMAVGDGLAVELAMAQQGA